MPFDGLGAALETRRAKLAGRGLILAGTAIGGALACSAAASALFRWGVDLNGRLAGPSSGLWSYLPRWLWDCGDWWRYAYALRHGAFSPDVGNRVLRWLYGGAGAGFLAALPFYAFGKEAVALWRKRSLHGETGWATARQIRRAGLRARKGGIILGRDARGYLALGGQESVALYAPPRSGKTSGVAVPNALAFDGSLVCIDLRGEIHDATAGARAESGQRVIRLDPFNPQGRTHRWNPLAHVRRGTVDTYGDIDRIAHQVIHDLPGTNAFFSKTARLGFVGVAMMLAENLDGPLTLNAIARVLVRADVRACIPRRLDARRREGRPYSRACADACRAFVSAPPETFQNIAQTIHADLGLYLNPRVAAMTAASDFDMRELRRELHAVYLTIHDEDLDALRPLTSLFFQQLVSTMTAVLPKDDPRSRYQVLGIMDEFVRLGKVPPLAHANAFVGGYDVRLIYIVQDRRQPEEHYGQAGARVLLTSCGVEAMLRTKDIDLAREVSERLGYDTVDSASETKSRAGGALAPKASATTSDAKRALLLPQEVLRLGEDEMLLFRAGIPAVKARRIKWWLDPTFKDAWRPAPAVPAIEVPYELDEGSGPELTAGEEETLATLWTVVPNATPDDAKAAIEGFVLALPNPS